MTEHKKCNCESKSLEADKSNGKWINQIVVNVCELIISLAIVYCLFTGCTKGCSPEDWQKSKELEIKERELIVREKEIDHQNLELQKIKELEK